MSRRKYLQVVDGIPYYPSKRGHREQCCDCGLVHRVNFHIEDKDGKPIRGARVRITAWRHSKATGGARRHFQFSPDED